MPPFDPHTQSSPILIPTLVGKSNFADWHSTILPILSSHSQSHALIFGSNLCESPLPLSLTSPTSIYSSSCSRTSSHASPKTTTRRGEVTLPFHNPPCTILTIDPILTTAAGTEELDHANLILSRFIRSTLAMNVLPFVRQHTTARALWEHLIDLYGEKAGIDRIGGPDILGVRDIGLDMGTGRESDTRRIVDRLMMGKPSSEGDAEKEPQKGSHHAPNGPLQQSINPTRMPRTRGGVWKRQGGSC